MYTNSNSKKDFIYNSFVYGVSKRNNIYIASAFFTYSGMIKEFIEKQCKVKLVVRLGYPTSAEALDYCMQHEEIQVRFYTARSFHPKLYIFGEDYAIVGSSNLTRSGLMTNQEIALKIERIDHRFEELKLLFSAYWGQAKVLTKAHVDQYKEILKRYSKIKRVDDEIDEAITKEIGRVEHDNIYRDKKKESSNDLYIEDYRKRYQEYVTAYRFVESVFKRYGKRKVSEEQIPLHVEIDSFFSYIRNKHAAGDSWRQAPILRQEEQEERIKELIDEWVASEYDYFDKTIVQENYPIIISAFKDKDTFNRLTIDEVVEALTVIHSFHDRLRFFPGGLSTLLDAFLEKNDHKKIMESLSYLVFESVDVEVRMANMLYNPKYRLAEFGISNIQELIGWVNKDGLPVVNRRTTKVMRYLGFDVPQL